MSLNYMSDKFLMQIRLYCQYSKIFIKPVTRTLNLDFTDNKFETNKIVEKSTISESIDNVYTRELVAGAKLTWLSDYDFNVTYWPTTCANIMTAQLLTRSWIHNKLWPVRSNSNFVLLRFPFHSPTWYMMWLSSLTNQSIRDSNNSQIAAAKSCFIQVIEKILFIITVIKIKYITCVWYVF